MSYSLSRNQLNQERQAAMPAQGRHQGRIIKVTTATKKTGNALIVVFQLETGQELVFSVLIEPSRLDLTSLSNAQKDLLLDLIQAGIGVDEVPDVSAALQGMLMQSTQVQVEVKHSQKDGRSYANAVAFAAVQQAGMQAGAPAAPMPGQGPVAAPMPGQGTVAAPMPGQGTVAAPAQSTAEAWNQPPHFPVTE